MIVCYHKFIKYRLKIASLLRVFIDRVDKIDSVLFIVISVNFSTLQSTIFLIKDSFLHIITPSFLSSSNDDDDHNNYPTFTTTEKERIEI